MGGVYFSKVVQVVGVFSFVAFVLGCAHVGSEGGSEARLIERANAYWQHKTKKEFTDAYPYECPELRKIVSLNNYVLGSAGGVIWIDVKVKSASIEGGLGKVKMDMTYAMFGMPGPKGGITQAITECWKYTEGDWYHLPDCPRKKWGSGAK